MAGNMSHTVTVFIDLVLRFKFCPEKRKIIVSEKFPLKSPQIYNIYIKVLPPILRNLYLNAYLSLP